jgi:hypothetical protein
LSNLDPVAVRAALSPLNDPQRWGSSDSSCPLSDEQVAAYQARIAAVVGTSNDRSIAKLVWNADKRFWREICVSWDTTGKAIEFIRRPIVLYRTRRDQTGKVLHDVPVPRWLILTRLEPEQYAGTWARDSRVWFPDRGQYVQVKPETPPADGWYVWLMTIAEHDAWCCRMAAEEDRACYGLYADPGCGIRELEKMRAGMERAGTPDGTPFDSPDRTTRKLRERSVNNYVEQSMRKYDEEVSRFADLIPNAAVRQIILDDKRRDLDEMQKNKGAI